MRLININNGESPTQQSNRETRGAINGSQDNAVFCGVSLHVKLCRATNYSTSTAYLYSDVHVARGFRGLTECTAFVALYNVVSIYEGEG